jgi:hypothetical protein
VHLNITSYSAGCFAVLTSLMAAIESPAWDLALEGSAGHFQTAAPLIAVAVAYLVAMLWCMYRYVDLLKRSAECSWLRAINATALTFIIFSIALAAGLMLLRPFIARLQ